MIFFPPGPEMNCLSYTGEREREPVTQFTFFSSPLTLVSSPCIYYSTLGLVVLEQNLLVWERRCTSWSRRFVRFCSKFIFNRCWYCCWRVHFHSISASMLSSCICVILMMKHSGISELRHFATPPRFVWNKIDTLFRHTYPNLMYLLRLNTTHSHARRAMGFG